ncbi:MAG TPA: porin [Myxococcota bacterium]|nr:porin [Myxococcota bacterium]
MTRKVLSMWCLVLSAALAFCPLAASAQDKDKKQEEKTGFEGWEEESKDEGQKPGAAPVNRDQRFHPAPAPAPVVKIVPPPVGPAAEEPVSHKGLLPSVDHKYGSLALMGLFQTLFESYMFNDDADNETVGFRFQRARIVLKGHLLSRNLEYFFQGDAGNMASFALDMFLRYKYHGFSLRVGRFLPDFTYMMPRDRAHLDAVNFPVFLTDGAFGVWRQIGFEIGYQANEQFTVKLGVFNGLMYEPTAVNPQLINMQMGSIETGGAVYTNYTDNNKAKDIMLRAAFKPMDTLSLDLNFWLGMPNNAGVDSDNDIVIMGGPGAEYNDGRLHLISEFMFRVISYGDPSDSKSSLALWAHIGYKLQDWLECVFRVEWLEPDMDTDDDMRLRFTAGGHFAVEQDHFAILADLFADIPAQSGNEAFGILVQASLAW